MGHKVLINGTAYDATGGTPLVNGTKFQMGGVKRLCVEPHLRCRLDRSNAR